MNGGIHYNLTCNHHETNECECVTKTLDMVMDPDSYPNMRHYVACVEAAVEHEGIQLRNYMSDLITWDRQTLEKEDTSLPFAFAVRESGTHLVRLSERDGVGHRCWEYPGFVTDSFALGKVRWWWWDGEKMTHLDSHLDAAKRLREECEARGLQKY